MANRTEAFHDGVPLLRSTSLKLRISTTIIAAAAIIAVAAWPVFASHRPASAQAYVAPVLPDYTFRNATIAFYEQRVRAYPQDQISAKLLAAQYMQRYREEQDVADILRAIRDAKRSLKLQPQNNAAADEIAASAYTALHLFPTALAYETAAHADQPNDSNAPSQMASLQMELGDYRAAARDLRIASAIHVTPTVLAVQARYDELTGNLERARTALARATAQSDAVADNSAQARAWYHFRAGELAFSAGDVASAEREERVAISQFGNFEMAYRALARFCWASRDWECALKSAQTGANIVPEPEILGYESDAQNALGDAAAAQRTRDLIYAVERLGNAYHINDRLLAVYYCEHGVRVADGLHIAQREVAHRGDEIYAQDTLAWCAAAAGQWTMARNAIRLATRYNTQDPRIRYHAAMIALHDGQTIRARSLLQFGTRGEPAIRSNVRTAGSYRVGVARPTFIGSCRPNRTVRSNHQSRTSTTTGDVVGALLPPGGSMLTATACNALASDETRTIATPRSFGTNVSPGTIVFDPCGWVHA